MSYPTEKKRQHELEPLRSAHFNSAREYESSDVDLESPREPATCSAVPSQAEIMCKNHRCIMSFSAEQQNIKITRTTPAGKLKTILFVPLYVVLNVETASECDARQTMRRANDDTTKEGFVVRNSRGLESACMGNCQPSTVGGSDVPDYVLYTHTRGDTGISMTTTTSPGASTSLFQSHRSSEQELYYIHYVRFAGRLKKSIHTVAFSAAPGQAEATASIVQRMIQIVYKGGTRHLMFFISPKSGSGQGQKVFEKEVKPLLHFTRHKISSRVTQRAHDCEDFCADVNNELSSDCVVIAVGGDGMVNEVINGLHRRKMTLLSRLRRIAEDASSTSSGDAGTDEYPTEESSSSPVKSAVQRDSLSRLRVPEHWNVTTVVREGWNVALPLVGTLATGSACGLAKSLGVLTSAEGALALVHLNTVDMDLVRMRFTTNDDLVRHHESRLSAKKREKVERRFESFQQQSAEANAHDEPAATATIPHGSPRKHRDPETPSALDSASASPFCEDGSGRFSTAVAHHLGAPDMEERIAFMSLSFGMANDIDRGSEHLRWMGNSRFTVYGGYCLLRGVRKYQTTLRYLPWTSVSTGKGLEKLHTSDTMPSTDELPICTMRTDCPHCRANQPTWYEARQAKLRGLLSHAVSNAKPATGDLVDVLTMDDDDVTISEMARTLNGMSESELLNEDVVDFSATEEDGWVTITGSFYNVLLCNLRDVAQDMLMAPRCHMSDGAIDVVFSRIMPGVTKGGGRKEFIQMMGSLEKGDHVEHGFVNYVKARAVEIKVDDGISMSDGEMMPLSSVQMTKMRNAVRFVRSD